ncbi:FAD-dependent oxidoreductase [Nonomuraea dietziae]|uniref:FAD-dependent oxidoreductase n=1 Tax=Nonomuraea dietziae TaxID=65515 RepID=UPI0033FCEC76
MPDDVVIVGASAGGLAVAEALRRKGYQGGLTLLGAESHPPYDRPPLSKQVLSGMWARERAHLRPADELSALEADFLLGDPAVRLDAAAREVITASGRRLRAQAVVLATGLTPVRLHGQDGLAGVHTLRTMDDALGLREDLLNGGRLVVVGEGVLGAEVAATARGMGVDAVEQAQVVAANLRGEDRPYVPLPYFWTDQYDTKIQAHGFFPSGARANVVEGDLGQNRFVALYHLGGKVTGVLGWNMAKAARLHRSRVADAIGG